MADIYHGRDHDSAWDGNSALAYVTGLLIGALDDIGRRHAFEIDEPFGYSPVIDLIFVGTGQRFRLRLEEVKPAPPIEEPHQ